MILSTQPMQTPKFEDKKPTARLYTMDIFIDVIDTDGSKKQQAVRLAVADATSVNRGSPTDSHALQAFSAKAVASLPLPKVPQNITVQTNGLRPPQAVDNPFQGVSWCYVLGVFGCQATCEKFVADYALQLLEKGVLAANVQIPNNEKSGA